MSPDSQAAIIANDLDTLIHRIEALPPHSSYTEAVMKVMAAKMAINAGRQDSHRREMKVRLQIS